MFAAKLEEDARAEEHVTPDKNEENCALTESDPRDVEVIIVDCKQNGNAKGTPFPHTHFYFPETGKPPIKNSVSSVAQTTRLSPPSAIIIIIYAFLYSLLLST